LSFPASPFPCFCGSISGISSPFIQDFVFPSSKKTRNSCLRHSCFPRRRPSYIVLPPSLFQATRSLLGASSRPRFLASPFLLFFFSAQRTCPPAFYKPHPPTAAYQSLSQRESPMSKASCLLSRRSFGWTSVVSARVVPLPFSSAGALRLPPSPIRSCRARRKRASIRL